MLIYVGFWLHSKSYVHAWDRFIRDQVGAALASKTLWAFAAISFLAVYRELFEVVLFYQALAAQAGSAGLGPLLGGIVTGALLLVAIGYAIFKVSIRLPLKLFFTAMSMLLALLAVVFAGNGVAALQEAGVVPADPIAFVSLPALGLHPTLETIAAQLAVLLVVIACFYLAGRGARSGASSQPVEIA
jgi:high-affinity iron transporter